MSWFVWSFGFFAILGASQFARFKGVGDGKVSAILLVGLIGAVGYFFVGRAELPGQPYEARVAEIAQRDPTTLSPAETLARLEGLVKEQPDAPQPHFFIGEMMRAQGRDSDAIRAYQSALRRDDRYVPAMIALGDAMVRLSDGRIDESAKQIYSRAVILDPSQVRAGFLAGLADWQIGNENIARTRWQAVREGVAPEDPRREMLDALVAGVEERASEAP